MRLRLLPTRRATWTREDLHEVVIHCQRAVIATLLCAADLRALGDIDSYSEPWICEALQKCREHCELMEAILERCCSMELKS